LLKRWVEKGPAEDQQGWFEYSFDLETDRMK